VAARSFKQNCEVRLIAATDPLVLTEGGFLFAPVPEFLLRDEEHSRRLVEELAERALAKLKDAGFAASFHLHTGNPKYVLPDEAEKWNADQIFVGANACGRRFERLLLGSVSAAVAARAHCSVEVVRRKNI
jgi:nucleotide-binding universal stress UspA family protein